MAGKGHRVSGLTPRQLDVLALAAEGKTNKGIGLVLGIKSDTVKNHLNDAFVVLRARTRTEAVAKALQRGWL